VKVTSDDREHRLHLEDGSDVVASTLVLATGVAWRRLAIPNLERLVGAGVFYGAGRSEAQAMRGHEVHVIGAGNSAGQAALHLAKHAARVTMIVRGSSLTASMSSYLIDEIANTPGIDVQTGAAAGPHVRAALTVTFGGLKPVHALGDCGRVELVDIGLALPDTDVLGFEAADVAARWPVPGPTDDKYTQGVVGVAAGSDTYPGAAVLATGAAVLATSGMVRFAGSAAQAVLARWPEVVTAPDVTAAGRTQAWAVGPGIGTDDAGRAVLAAAVAKDVPLVVDADGITLLADHDELRAAIHGRPVLLTPHAGEFARIAGEVGADRIAAARRAAAELGVTVLLKGNATVVADPDGRALVHPSSGSWAATAGSGDVLTGISGALLAAGLEPWWAAGCAAFVHARAADLAADGIPTPASRLQAHIPAALRSLGGLAAG